MTLETGRDEEAIKREALENGFRTLSEAEQKLEETPAAQALWRIRSIFGHGAMLSTLSSEAQKELKEAAEILERLPEIKALRKVERALKEKPGKK